MFYHEKNSILDITFEPISKYRLNEKPIGFKPAIAKVTLGEYAGVQTQATFRNAQSKIT